tara:strand:- start:209 stop:430 length:222 start_codon:yes stop_codon:yes gene_type:complete
MTKKKSMIKALESKISFFIEKAESFIESKPEIGRRYLALANQVYDRIPPDKKGKETELELTLNNLNYRYTSLH